MWGEVREDNLDIVFSETVSFACCLLCGVEMCSDCLLSGFRVGKPYSH